MRDAAPARLYTADEIERREPGRGRDAERPRAIPRKGWLDIALRVWASIGNDRVGLIAAGVAFWGLLAIFPAITALMSIAGLVYRPAELVDALQGVSSVVPPDVSRILLDQATSVAGGEQSGLTLGVVLGLALALWSASVGVGSLLQGLNVAYDESEKRGIVMLKLLTILMTVALIVGVLLTAIMIVLVPIALAFLDFAPGFKTAISMARFVPMALLFLGVVLALYRWGPSRRCAKWRWLVPGAVVAGILWLVASIGFSLYVTNFSSYNETFGSIAGVIVLLMWMWLSAYAVLIGAEVNAEIEAQTARDSTIGPREPMGYRQARKADQIGRAR